MEDEVAIGRATRHLYLTLLALSLPGDLQIALFPADSWIRRADELAEEYATGVSRLKRRDSAGALMVQGPLLQQLDELLKKMSDDKSLWSDQALLRRPEWEYVRSVAKEVLRSGGWPDVPASELLYVLGPPADPSVYNRVADEVDRRSES